MREFSWDEIAIITAKAGRNRLFGIMLLPRLESRIPKIEYKLKEPE
ncbi:hypothetical protein [Marinimicrobium sp. ABcell2]|nr:hypothetical protein [Marinimicrobium sp. ABcell2]MDQ2077141.1 hypothetical protein [Marinimicrobium sp. ABcell2]